LSRLERKIENIIAGAEDSKDLIIEIINCFSPEEADNIFGKLDIRGKVFVDYQIGVYRILPTRPHEVCASGVSDSLSRGAERVGIRSLISLTGASRTELWGFIPEVYNEFIDTNVAKSGRKTQKFKNMFTRSKTRNLAQPLERSGSNQIKNQLKKKEPDSSVCPAYYDLLEELRKAKHGPQLSFCPPVVIETGYSETLKLLEGDAKFWTVGSEFIVEQMKMLRFDPKTLTLTAIHLDFSVKNLMRILSENDEAEGRMLTMEERDSLLRCVSSRIDMKTTEAELL
jgi:hypothetical protein